MTPDEYRRAIKAQYLANKDWWTKVRGMSDDQIEKYLEATDLEEGFEDEEDEPFCNGPCCRPSGLTV